MIKPIQNSPNFTGKVTIGKDDEQRKNIAYTISKMPKDVKETVIQGLLDVKDRAEEISPDDYEGYLDFTNRKFQTNYDSWHRANDILLIDKSSFNRDNKTLGTIERYIGVPLQNEDAQILMNTAQKSVDRYFKLKEETENSNNEAKRIFELLG